MTTNIAREFGLDPTEVAQWPWQKRLHWQTSLAQLDEEAHEEVPDVNEHGQTTHPDVSHDPTATPGVSKHDEVISAQ